MKEILRQVVREVVYPVLKPTSSPFGDGEVDLAAWWATLISATVDDFGDHGWVQYVMLTFPTSQPSLLFTDLICTVDGNPAVISSASWTGAVWAVVLQSVVMMNAVVRVTFVPSGDTVIATNNSTFYV